MKAPYLALLAAVLAFAAPQAAAQRFSLGTNGVDWFTLGTLNGELSLAVSQHYSVHVGTKLNPWTFNPGDQQKQFQIRQSSYWGGLRWWPWHVFSGWWTGGELRYSLYNAGGISKRDTEEGDAYGVGAYGGYSIMLGQNWNLDLGFGLWGGYKKYVRYVCPICGARSGNGETAFVLPDARVAFQWIF